MALPSWSTRTSSTGAASSPTASGWRAGRRLALLEAALRTLADAARGGHGRFLEPLRAQGAHPVGPALGRVVEPVGHRVLHIGRGIGAQDRKSTRLNSSHSQISYAVFCFKKKKASTRSQRH